MEHQWSSGDIDFGETLFPAKPGTREQLKLKKKVIE